MESASSPARQRPNPQVRRRPPPRPHTGTPASQSRPEAAGRGHHPTASVSAPWSEPPPGSACPQPAAQAEAGGQRRGVRDSRSKPQPSRSHSNSPGRTSPRRRRSSPRPRGRERTKKGPVPPPHRLTASPPRARLELPSAGAAGSAGEDTARGRAGVPSFRPSQLPAASSAGASLPRAPLGRASCGVLAAPVWAVWAVAWLLLGAAVELGRTAAATSADGAPTDGIRATCSEIIVKQEILKDGFHRDLSIKVNFGESGEDLQPCRLLIKQHIPTGLLVDPYELASLREKNITEAVMVSENVDIEAPNYLSKESEVLISARRDLQCMNCFQAFVPVHCRYHRPHGEVGEALIMLRNPDLLMRCDQEFPILRCWAQSQVAAPCALKKEDICQWKNMKYKSASKNVTLQVPVGVAIHTPLVCFVTLFVTVLCSMLILVTVFKHGHFSL